MKPQAYSYPNDTFRGFVLVYDGMSTAEICCKEVRKNKLKSLDDAKKLMLKIRQEKKLLVK